MVFKPTRQQTQGISNTNIVQATGLREMARTFSQIGNAVGNVAKARRSTEFSNAMLDAELAGRQAVTRDGDGKLRPLNNLDWDSGLIYTEDANRAKEVFKRTAINTYSTALKVDTEEFATNLFNDNVRDPDAIIEAGDAYMLNLKQNLDPEVYNAIEPSLQTSFINKISTAKANLRTFVQKETETNAKSHLKFITNETANLLAINATTGTDFNQDIELRLNELNNEKEKLRDDFEAAGYTPSQIDDIFKGTQQFVQERVSTEYIKHFWNERDQNMPMALEEIERVKASLKGNPDIDISRIETVMKQSLTSEWNIQNEKKKIYDREQKATYGSARLDIYLGEITTKEQITELVDASGNPLNDDYQASLLALFGDGGTKASKAAQDKLIARQSSVWRENAKAMIAELETNPENRPEKINKLMEHIKFGKQKNYDLVPGYEWGTFYGQFIGLQKKFWDEKIKEGNDVFMANVEHEMHENAEYFRDPGYFRELTDYLIENKIIGEGDGVYSSISTWSGKVDDYALRWQKNEEKLFKHTKALENARAGASNNINDLVTIDGYVSKVVVNGKTENLDMMSSNPDIAKASQEAIIQFSIEYNTVHDQLKTLLNQFHNIEDEATYKTVLATYTNIMEGFKKKKGKLRYDQGYHRGISYFEANGVDTGIMEYARIVPFETAQKMFATFRSPNAQRIENNISTNGEDEDVYLKRIMNEATDEESMFSWIVSGATAGLYDPDDISPYQRELVNRFRQQSGGLSLNKAIFDYDTQLFTLMSNIIKSKIIHKQVDNSVSGHKQAVISTMGELGDNIGFSETEDGTVYLSLHPFMQEFQKEMPANFELTPESVFQHIRDTFNNMHDANGVLWSNEARELFEEGKFILIPNETYGKQVDYKVFVKDKYGAQYLLFDNYRYDYKTSRDQKAYQKAFEEFKDKSNIKKIWSALPGMDDVIFRGQVKKWQSTYNSTGVVKEIIDAYNFLGNTLGGYNFEPIDPENAEITDDEWQLFFSSFLSLGIK